MSRRDHSLSGGERGGDNTGIDPADPHDADDPTITMACKRFDTAAVIALNMGNGAVGRSLCGQRRGSQSFVKPPPGDTSMRKDQGAADMGSVAIDLACPEIVVGCSYAVRITYTAGPHGIREGGAVRFKLPGLHLKGDRAGPVSCSNPEVEWACSNHLPAVNGKDGCEFFTGDYLFVVVTKGRLRQGDSITVRHGHGIGRYSAFAGRCAMQWPVEAAVDIDGSRAAPGSGFYLVENPPVLRFVNDKPFGMEVSVPSYASVGEPFRAVVRVMDRHHNLVRDYTGTVVLGSGSGEQPVTIGTHAFGPEDEGVHVFENARLDAPGVHRLVARDEALWIGARSNPIKISQRRNGPRLFWGDTHCHSRFSADTSAVNCLIADPAGDYDYARNRAALDFCMVTDHIEDQSEREWEETRRAAAAAYEPGRFVTFSGFEATYAPLRREGDKNVYFLSDDEEWVNEGTTEELYANLKRRRSPAMVIPHLHGPTNWDRHDPELERVVEIYAHWGCGLSQDSTPPIIPGTPRRPESYVHHALEKGARLGFIASADHSWGHPGDDFWWPLSAYNGGLAAVFSTELTREGIWRGLRARRCYGTTRARILLEFEINGHAMGEEFVADGRSRQMTVNVYGTTALAAVEIVKNGRCLHRFPGNRRIDLELTCHDDAPERNADYYYVHVVQEDAEQAWSSPVWVSRPGG